MPIRFSTYNIRNGSNGGLESALRGVSQTNMDPGIFQETKVADGIYNCGSSGYSVLATNRRADTTAKWLCFTVRHRISRWKQFRNLDSTLSASSRRRGSGGGTSWDVTSPLTTH